MLCNGRDGNRVPWIGIEMALGKRIRSLHIAAELTQKELGEASGVTESAILEVDHSVPGLQKTEQAIKVWQKM